MYFLILALTVAAATLVLLAVHDLRHRRLPNFWVGLYAFLFIPFYVFSGFGWAQLGWHFICAGLTAAITAVFFALRWMGGGDVKLWSAVMLWAGPYFALPAIIIATLVGAILGVVAWLAQWRLRRVPKTAGRHWLRLISADRGVPYGVGLAMAGLFVIAVYAVSIR